MSYDDIASIFLIPGDETIAEPTVPSSPARRLRDALEPIATIGWWSREAAAGAESLGLDFFGNYVWGRAAALGADVSASVVTAAFGVFDADAIGAVLAGARSQVSADDVLATRAAGAEAGLRNATTAVDGSIIAEVADILLPALESLDGMLRPLFSALRSLPMPVNPHGRLWRAAELVREHRGDGHLAAAVAAGLSGCEMNIVTELWLGYPIGEYSATRAFPESVTVAAVEGLRRRGWIDDDSRLTQTGRDGRDAIEVATDVSQDALIEALGTDLDGVIAGATTVSDAVLERHAAPSDPRKRAAG